MWRVCGSTYTVRTFCVIGLNELMLLFLLLFLFFFFNDTATTEIYTLSLHDALPISLFRNGWFQCFSVYELKVPKVPYLEMGGSNVFLFRD